MGVKVVVGRGRGGVVGHGRGRSSGSREMRGGRASDGGWDLRACK